jgi:hypothetical protein
VSEEEYSKYHVTVLEIMTGPLVKEAGVTYLEEDTHTFALNNGAEFAVYASLYTHRSDGLEPLTDRFNNANQSVSNRTSDCYRSYPLSCRYRYDSWPFAFDS